MKFSVITSTYNQLDQLIRVWAHLKVQTFLDFEWIVADDGSSDGTREYVENLIMNSLLNIKYVTQPDEGYQLTKILNKGAALASGDNLVWIMGDSYPKEDFLEQLSKHTGETKVLNGIRLNVDKVGTIISQDWRIERVMFDIEQDETKIITPRPWELMTLNSMCMPRSAYEKMGGIYPGYKGYGRMDWDMAAWAHYNGMGLFWTPKAVIFHEAHKEREDTKDNMRLFEERLSKLQAPTIAHNERIQAKMDIIMDPKRAQDKKAAMLKKREETANILEMGADDDDEI